MQTTDFLFSSGPAIQHSTASLLPADISLGSISCMEIKRKAGNKGILKGNSLHFFSSQAIKQDKDDFRIKHTLSLGCHLQTDENWSETETMKTGDFFTVFSLDFFNWQICKAPDSSLNLKEKKLSSWLLLYFFYALVMYMHYGTQETTSHNLESSCVPKSYSKN